MAATVRIAKVAHALAGRVRISKVSFFSTPGGPNARVRISRVGFFVAGGPAAKVRVASVQFYVRDALTGVPLIVEFNGESWQTKEGQLVMFVGGDWQPA